MFYPAPGLRHPYYGTLYNIGRDGFGWTSSFTGANVYRLDFHYNGIYPNSHNCRSYGFQTRCLQE
ncbi:MAG: hypothetical protein K2G93_08585 [Rikenella sp.]|nr:hypothetical protein [Rikenella sp.]